MPFLMAIPLIASVGGLVFKVVADETQQTVQTVDRAAPNVALIGALALAGVVVWKMAGGRK